MYLSNATIPNLKMSSSYLFGVWYNYDAQALTVMDIKVSHNDKQVKIDFRAVEFKSNFKIDGIIGTNFLMKNKAIIDLEWKLS